MSEWREYKFTEVATLTNELSMEPRQYGMAADEIIEP